MIKKIILTSLFITSLIYAQAEFVEIENPVYNFFERMKAQHLIKQYDEFEIPKTRREIGEKLKQIDSEKLISPDRQQYSDLLIEFDNEVSNTVYNTISMFESGFDLLSDKSKYLYFNKSKSGNVFISFLSEADFINHKVDNSAFNSARLMKIGGRVRGTILNKFGYSITGTNGKGFGHKPTAYLKQELQYNLKFNENNENFFDVTEGHFTADFDLIKFKIGRDRMNIGPGIIKPILNSFSPQFDYLSLQLHYDIISFSFFHGKLLGEITNQRDPVTGGSLAVSEKYLGYHRLNFNFSQHFSLGAGEMIIYGDRPLDLSYLNPFNFYKTVEHSNRDRDNSLLFFDIVNNSIKHLKFYSLLLIDDITFSKLNTGWWGNQFMLNTGVAAFNINNLPLDIRLEYLRIEPYTFTHRLSRNSYTNQNYNLGSFAEPNSELYLAGLNYRLSGRLHTGFEFSYYVHGANTLNEDGTIKENVGGDILLGHRLFDSAQASFLAGDLEYVRSTSVFLTFEPVNQFIFSFRFSYINETLQKRLSQEHFQSFINLSIKI